MNEDGRYFGFYDYIVFMSVLAISSGIGLYYRFSGGRQKTFKEYMLADQKMSMVPVAFSLMASFMSAITILGVSNENYRFGTQFIVINISYILSTPIVCYLFLPVFFGLQKISVNEYLEMRFGKATRLIASMVFSLQMTLYMGIVLFAPALALSAVTGLVRKWSIIAVGAVCTFYSALGGMKAVLITDVFQSLLMFTAVLTVVFKGLLDFGISDILKYAFEGERIEFFNFSVDPRVRHTVWNLSIGGSFTYCSIYGINQAQVQRLLTIKSLKKAQGSLWLQWIILMCLSLCTSFSGLVLYAQYRSCDPLLSNKISNSDQILPFYVVENLGLIPGISGLFVSGIFSGSLSTVSSALNSLSAVTVHDYLMPCFPSLSKRDQIMASTLSKLISVFYGALCVGIAFMAQRYGKGVLQASFVIFGAVGGPLLSVFTLGMLFRSVNQKGAISGLVCGLLLSLWLGFGQPKPVSPTKPLSVEGCLSNGTVNDLDVDGNAFKNVSSVSDYGNDTFTESASNSFDSDTTSVNDFNLLHEFYSISYMWISTIGFSSTLIIGLLVSYATGGYKRELDESLLFEFKRKRTRNEIELTD